MARSAAPAGDPDAFRAGTVPPREPGEGIPPDRAAPQTAIPAKPARLSERETLETLEAQVVSYRYKAGRYAEIRDQIATWQAKADRYDRLAAALAKRNLQAAVARSLLRRVAVPHDIGGQVGANDRAIASPESRLASAVPERVAAAPAAHARESRNNAVARVCILSRKDLRDITRVPRMAKALIDAGYAVTVVALRAPVQQLRDMCPQVEYLSVTPRPVTARLLARGSRSERTRSCSSDSGGRSAFARALRLATFPVWSAKAVRRVAIIAPFTLVLKKSNESFAEAWRAAAADSTLTTLSRFGGQLHQWALTHAFAKAADKATRGRRFDVVQAHDNYAIVAAARLAARDRAKLVYDAVELSSHRLALDLSRLEALRERCERREEAAIFRKADLMLAVGDGVANWYARSYAIDRPLVVRNCRYYWEYRADGRLRADAGLADTTRVVVWSGSAYPQQGLELLIDAVPFMPPHIHVAIVATALPRWTTYLNDLLPQRAAALGVADRTHFLPAQEPNDLVPYISGADLGVIPRPSEHLNNFLSMPNKFLEMVMARLPVAVSRVGDMAEAVARHGIGAVFDERDPANMAAVLEGMLAPAAYRELKANVMTAAQEMTWERESVAYISAIGALVPTPAIAAPVSRPAAAAASRSPP